ncbi:MAG: hypothetical protein JST90_06765 [Bacteroidetes bacterium]|nr:hypothetical protein [Bacteroidota bacterium]
MNKNKGSEWRRWDLHFHSQSSYDYGNKNLTNQQIVDGLVANNVSVVAITDHHIIDVDRIRELQELGTSKGLTVLPGIEFLADARGQEPIHFIAIFSEKADLEHIWGQIKHKTNIHKIDSEGLDPNQVYCDLIDTIKIVKELNGIVTIHAGKKSNSIENITNSLEHNIAQKQDIARNIDVFEIGKESDQAGYKTHVIPFLKRTIGKLIPMIICSDNHNISEYEVKQNLWIKAEPNFEGLKQILYEPEARVRIQKDKPDYKEDRVIIEEIKFHSSNNTFPGNSIFLSENLNVIIGGKSSGKSILLYNIAKTLLADKSILNKEKIENKYDFRSDDVEFNFEIITKGGFPQRLYRESTENSIIPEIKYIPQNYLIKLAEPDKNKTGNALNKIIRELINEDNDSRRTYDFFVSQVKANDRKREAIIDAYFDIKDRIAFLNEQLKTKTHKDILKSNIESNIQKVAELNQEAGLDAEQIIKYNELQSRLDRNKLELTKAENDCLRIVNFNKDAFENLSNLKTRKGLLQASLENDSIKEIFNKAYLTLDSFIEELTAFMVSVDECGEEQSSNELSEIFSNLNKEGMNISEEIKPYLRGEETKRQIDSILTSISEDRTTQQAIDQLTKELEGNSIALEREKEKLFALYEENYNLYLQVIFDLKSRVVDLEKDGLKIDGIVKFNFSKFRRAILDISDGRSASYGKYRIFDNHKDSLSDYVLTEIIQDIKSIFSAIESGDYVITSKATVKSTISLLLNDFFFDYWQIEYKGDTLRKMSAGKASFIILMLIVGLSKSKAPILIDQPEDNLDNRSITKDLVEYLRNKKLDRQIILVTHNANVVVNADAENIIVANQKGQEDIETTSPYRFDYINGSLENTYPFVEGEKNLLKSMGIREHIADIVEGGKEAFKKREEKYGFR